MPHYLLDTNHAGRMLDADSPWRARLTREPPAEFGISRPTVGELWFMVFNSQRVVENTRDLEDLLNRLTVWEYDDRAAVEFGRIQTELRRKGRPIPGIDVQVAAIARLNDLTVLSADRHLSFVPNLTIENWLT